MPIWRMPSRVTTIRLTRKASNCTSKFASVSRSKRKPSKQFPSYFTRPQVAGLRQLAGLYYPQTPGRRQRHRRINVFHQRVQYGNDIFVLARGKNRAKGDFLIAAGFGNQRK